jgi:hypothetical protein
MVTPGDRRAKTELSDNEGKRNKNWKKEYKERGKDN